VGLMFDRHLILANLQWAALDYDLSKQHHMTEGTEESMARALAAWQALERALEHHALLSH